MGVMVECLVSAVEGVVFRVLGIGCRVKVVQLRVWGAGCRVKVVGFRVQGTPFTLK